MNTGSFSLVFCLVLGLFHSLLFGDIPRRSFLAADSSKEVLLKIDERGQTEWKYRIGPLHDLQTLPNGHLLFQTDWTRIVEVDPKTDRVLWEYDAKKSTGNANQKVEVHAFQRLADGTTFIAESGRARFIEVDRQGVLRKETLMEVWAPHPHRDTRLARKLENGNIIACHEGDGAVREYDESGSIVWEYLVPLFDEKPRPGHGPEAYGNQCFGVLRLPSGNTLISTGNGHRVLEVNHEKEIVWQLAPADLPQYVLAWITTIQVLPSGNLVLVNCHAGPDQPQIIEVTREKKVVWTFKDFERFGNSLTNAVILSVDGQPVR
jgi:outer membrane protein assembly factor BamB